MEFNVRLFAAIIQRRTLRDSFWQVGLSVFAWSFSSSQPLTQRRAFRVSCPPFIFSVHTQRHEILGWPVSGTSSYAPKSLHLCQFWQLTRWWAARGLCDLPVWPEWSGFPDLLAESANSPPLSPRNLSGDPKIPIQNLITALTIVAFCLFLMKQHWL